MSVMLCKFCGQAAHGGRCEYDALRLVAGARYEALQLARLEMDARKKIEGVGIFHVQSLVSHRTEKPRIDLQFGNIHTQMETDAAMDVAKNIIECCAGSYADAFLFNFLKEKLHQVDAVAISILQDFRDYRLTLAEDFQRMQENRDGA